MLNKIFLNASSQTKTALSLYVRFCVCQIYIFTYAFILQDINIMCVHKTHIYTIFERKRRSDADKFAKIIQISEEVHTFLF